MSTEILSIYNQCETLEDRIWDKFKQASKEHESYGRLEDRFERTDDILSLDDILSRHLKILSIYEQPDISEYTPQEKMTQALQYVSNIDKVKLLSMLQSKKDAFLRELNSIEKELEAILK